MSLLLDRILAHISLSGDERELCAATVMKATNVAEYLFGTPHHGPLDFQRDYPNIAPPWPNFFVEYDMPEEIFAYTHDLREERSPWYGPKTFGLHWRAAERCQSDFSRLEDLLRFVIGGLPESSVRAKAYSDATDRAHWIAYVLMYNEYRKHEPRGPEWAYIFPITETGQFFVMPASSEDAGKEIIAVAPCDLAKWPNPSETVMRVVFMALAACLLAISFCHCRNVAIAECNPPVKLSKRHEKRYGRPLLRYNVIEIEPVRKILESEGSLSHTGLSRALHICRGHFKQYTARGLFGKLQGTYWWPTHVRGNHRAGIVLTDYDVSR